jgi:hypothetical protein
LRLILVNRAAANALTTLAERTMPAKASFYDTAINTSMLQAATAPEQNG